VLQHDTTAGGVAMTRASGLVLTTRFRLLDRLAEHAGTPVVSVSAPAGSGKSVLMSQWEERDARAHRTVRLAAWQNSPGALVELILDALDDLGPSTDEVRQVLSDQEPRLSATTLPALGQVLATRREPFVLVLDDVHLLTDLACARVLESLCESVPLGSQVALVSRSRTPEWLARTRVEGRLLELTSQDLAFSLEETGAFVRSRGLLLPAEVVETLAQRTEGWPVGLYLAARSIEEGAPDGGGLAALQGIGAERPTRDYLRSQVLAPLDEDERAFLRRTSLFEVVTPSLCDAVLERDDSATTLAALARQIQLIVPLDRRGDAYRYHHLLGEALAADLAEHEPSVVAGLHGRAAAWYLQQGAVDEAIRHAIGSGDLELAGKLVFMAAPLAIGIGNPDRLARWLAPLPDTAIASERWLTLSSCWLCIMGGSDADDLAAKTWVRRAQRHAGPSWLEDATTDEYAAHVAVVTAIVGRDDVAEEVEIASSATAGLPPDSPFLSAAYSISAFTSAVAGLEERNRTYAQGAIEVARAFGVPTVEADQLSWQALVAFRTHDTHAGLALAEQVAELVREHHLERLATSTFTMSVQALALCARGRLDEAAAALGTARRLSLRTQAILPWLRVLAPVLQARVSIRLGDHDGARLLLSEARAHLTDDLRQTWLVELADDTEALMRTVPQQAGRATALTAAEMRVLQFMPTHLTYPQVGEHLFLSANTVKTHALSIYRKLGVTSRDQAVLNARELGLLESIPSL
jgi:LuxR family maltose regulon positive regulatory protein